VNRERRGFVRGASALVLLSGSSAAFAQQKHTGLAPAQMGLVKPTSRAELLAVLQAAADTQTVVVLDPTTDVSVDKTVEIVQRVSTSQAWGVIGNGAKIRSTVQDGTPVIKYKVVVSDPKNGTSSRGLTIQTLDIIGSLKDGPGLMLHAPSGMAAFYRAVIRDNTTSLSGGLGALHIKGAVFELLVAGHMSENNKQHGVAIEHEDGAIVSNCMIHALNSSRNGKAGLYTESNIRRCRAGVVREQWGLRHQRARRHPVGGVRQRREHWTVRNPRRRLCKPAQLRSVDRWQDHSARP
jgi:hypothetical protein